MPCLRVWARVAKRLRIGIGLWREELRVLWQTPPFPSHPFACLPGLAPARREALQAGFLALAANPANHGLLDAIQIPEPVRADYRRDYQPLLGLGLERFAVVGSD